MNVTSIHGKHKQNLLWICGPWEFLWKLPLCDAAIDNLGAFPSDLNRIFKVVGVYRFKTTKKFQFLNKLQIYWNTVIGRLDVHSRWRRWRLRRRGRVQDDFKQFLQDEAYCLEAAHDFVRSGFHVQYDVLIQRHQRLSILVCVIRVAADEQQILRSLFKILRSSMSFGLDRRSRVSDRLVHRRKSFDANRSPPAKVPLIHRLLTVGVQVLKGFHSVADWFVWTIIWRRSGRWTVKNRQLRKLLQVFDSCIDREDDFSQLCD